MSGRISLYCPSTTEGMASGLDTTQASQAKLIGRIASMASGLSGSLKIARLELGGGPDPVPAPHGLERESRCGILRQHWANDQIMSENC